MDHHKEVDNCEEEEERKFILSFQRRKIIHAFVFSPSAAWKWKHLPLHLCKTSQSSVRLHEECLQSTIFKSCH